MTVSPEEIKPLIESSNYRSYLSYQNADFEDSLDKVPHSIESQKVREMDFLSNVDESKGPIKRVISKMVRKKVGNQEYLIHTERWYGRDWKNAKVKPVIDAIQGVHKVVDIEPKIDERNRKIGSEYVGNHDEYETPFTQKAVDKLLEETGTEKNQVEYVVRTPTRRDKCVNYDQFVGTSWIQANDIMMQDGGFELNYVESLRTNSSSHNIKPKS